MRCLISVASDVSHLQQIMTGFTLLARQGRITLQQDVRKEARANYDPAGKWWGKGSCNLTVTIDDRIRVCYDTHDAAWIDQALLHDSDFYFKRSFDPVYLDGAFPSMERGKIHALGLNYAVDSPGFDWLKVKRSALYTGRDRVRALLKGVGVDLVILGRSHPERLTHLEASPDTNANPRVLFMTRVWDPDRIESPGQADMVRSLNAVRADCVRALRGAFGSAFFGGLVRDEFALRHYADCVLPSDETSGKRQYLELLRQHPICVTSTGLNGSNGWRLGEYVALSKAIVTEPLRYAVPGGFREGENYLAFHDEGELVDAVTRLRNDSALRISLMEANHRYYRDYLRPDALVGNTLAIVNAGIRSESSGESDL